MAPGPRLLSEQRRRKILEFIEQKGQITVRELASRFSVSAVTARGDLDALCAERVGPSISRRRGTKTGIGITRRKHF